MAKDDTMTVEEQTTEHRPFDVMVASFRDKDTAREAYQALRQLEKKGDIDIEGAVVLNRDAAGRVRVDQATMPAWVWGMAAIAATSFLTVVSLGVWGIGRAVMRRGGGGGE